MIVNHASPEGVRRMLEALAEGRRRPGVIVSVEVDEDASLDVAAPGHDDDRAHADADRP